jgi:hypothetical protein
MPAGRRTRGRGIHPLRHRRHSAARTTVAPQKTIWEPLGSKDERRHHPGVDAKTQKMKRERSECVRGQTKKKRGTRLECVVRMQMTAFVAALMGERGRGSDATLALSEKGLPGGGAPQNCRPAHEQPAARRHLQLRRFRTVAKPHVEIRRTAESRTGCSIHPCHRSGRRVLCQCNHHTGSVPFSSPGWPVWNMEEIGGRGRQSNLGHPSFCGTMALTSATRGRQKCGGCGRQKTPGCLRPQPVASGKAAVRGYRVRNGWALVWLSLLLWRDSNPRAGEECLAELCTNREPTKGFTVSAESSTENLSIREKRECSSLNQQLQF